MADLIALTCPSCGGELEIPDGAITFSCKHCGTQYMVKDPEGSISLSVMGELKGIRSGTDRTASELAIKRLEEEISELKREFAMDRWLFSLAIAQERGQELFREYFVDAMKSRGERADGSTVDELLLKVSIEEMIQIMDRLRESWDSVGGGRCWMKSYPECLEDLEKIISMKGRIDDLESKLKKHKQIVSQ